MFTIDGKSIPIDGKSIPIDEIMGNRFSSWDPWEIDSHRWDPWEIDGNPWELNPG